MVYEGHCMNFRICPASAGHFFGWWYRRLLRRRRVLVPLGLEIERGKGRGPGFGIRPENDRLLAELLRLDVSALELIVEGLAADAVTRAKLAHPKCLSC